MQRRRVDARTRRHARPRGALLTRAAAFDSRTLEILSTQREVVIETRRPDGRARRTTIWVVLVDGRVFVRSVRGERGHWFQAALDFPDDVVLHAGKVDVAARARLATDGDSIELCSSGLRAKYERDPSLGSMLQPEVLGTTIVLEPR